MKLPPDTRAAIGILPGTHGAAIVLARSPREPSLDELFTELTREGGFHVLVRCGAGVSWPDKLGAGMVEYALGKGDVAAIVFDRLTDALKAQQRLRDGGAA